jgi:hypothetical protein
MLRFKEDVRIGYMTDAICLALRVASVWSAQHKLDVVVNSIADSAPGRVPTSLHPFDLAVDVEPLGNVQADRQALADYFRVQLPAGYDIVFESSHVHVECDAHRPPLREIAG